MIQIDTHSPETGQVASQGMRNSRSDQNGEDPIEFAQVWSEINQSETPKIASPSIAQSPTVEQSDAAFTKASPEIEASEVQPRPHPVETQMIETEGPQPFHTTHEGAQKLQANAQSDPRVHQLSAATLAPVRNSIPGEGRPDAAQASKAVDQFVAPTVKTETSVPALPVAKANTPSAPLPTSGQAPENFAVLPHSNPSSASSAVASLTAFGEGNTRGQPQRKLFTDRAPVQAVLRNQDSKARPPIEGAKNQVEQMSALSEKPTVQKPLSSAVQAPVQNAAQKQNPLPTLPLPPQPKTEPSIPTSLGSPGIELAAPQPLHGSVANTSTSVSPAPHPNAPQVVSQIVAAISQPSGATTEILLNPEELGRVRISLTNGDAGITVNILAERAETTDIMRRNIELLARELRDMGYENPNFTFDGRSDGSSDGWDDDHSEPAPENPISATETPTPSILVTLTGGLDLKL